MPEQSKRSSNFWQELKRRNVIHLMTVYIAAAFGLLELTDIITGPLNLPGWVINVVMVAATIGFPVAFLIAWFSPASRAPKTREVFQHADLEQDPEREEVAFDSGDLVPDRVGPAGEIPEERTGKGRIQIWGITSLVVIAAATILFLFYSGKSVPFKERDWIVIADFENLTEEEIFDQSLNTAFALSINQSRHINVYSRQRMLETLKRMKTDDLGHIDAETGKEIALREGVDVYVVPSISRVGSQYILTVRIQEAQTGNIFRSEVLYAKGQDEIIRKLDQLTKKIRRNLGESRYKISGQDKPLEKVTTSSLEALKEYSTGFDYHINLDFEQAAVHYENAIRIDSGFTTAKASLGNLLYEKFDKKRGREWLDQAIVNIDDLTDTEKYSILAFYAVNVENNLDKGIDYMKTIIELYPDISEPHNNLGWYYYRQGKLEKALEEYKAALRINPYMMLTYGGVIWSYLSDFGQMDSALVWSEKMIKYGPESAWGYYYKGCAYVGKDNLKEAEKAYLTGKEVDPNLTISQYRLAHVYHIQGEYDNAIDVLKGILRLNPAETPAHYSLGIVYNLMGEVGHAREHFHEYKVRTQYWVEAFPENAFSYTTYGKALTQMGEKDQGWEIGKKAIEMDSTIHFDYAEFLAVQGKKSDALDHLEKAIQNGYRDLVWLKLSPDIHLLSKEPRFSDLMNQYFNK